MTHSAGEDRSTINKQSRAHENQPNFLGEALDSGTSVDAHRAPLAAGEGFPKSCRLRSKKVFDEIYARNQVVMDGVLVIGGQASNWPWTRLGISVPKRVGNAPQRNRWKRLIREAFRRNRSELPAGLDIVVRPRKGSVAEYQSITQSLRRLIPLLAKQIRSS